MKNKFNFFLVSLLFPVGLFAFTLNGNFKSVIDEILSIISILLPILSGLAFLYFFWGLSKFILNSDKPEDIKNGKAKMLWGVLALFVLISVGSIISFISNELEIKDNTFNPSEVLKTNAQ